MFLQWKMENPSFPATCIKKKNFIHEGWATPKWLNLGSPCHEKPGVFCDMVSILQRYITHMGTINLVISRKWNYITKNECQKNVDWHENMIQLVDFTWNYPLCFILVCSLIWPFPAVALLTALWLQGFLFDRLPVRLNLMQQDRNRPARCLLAGCAFRGQLFG